MWILLYDNFFFCFCRFNFIVESQINYHESFPTGVGSRDTISIQICGDLMMFSFFFWLSRRLRCIFTINQVVDKILLIFIGKLGCNY